jgi:hypothetical protein
MELHHTESTKGRHAGTGATRRAAGAKNRREATSGPGNDIISVMCPVRSCDWVSPLEGREEATGRAGQHMKVVHSEWYGDRRTNVARPGPQADVRGGGRAQPGNVAGPRSPIMGE